MPGSKTLLALTLGICLFLSFFSKSINPYFFDILLSIGINIILAVGLNLVMGHTGQFSLGHAGFMATGAYLSGSFTTFYARPILAHLGGGPISSTSLFLLSLVIGGAGAAIAGLAVGLPSLRLKGDYLAIVTLGFGEIIRVIIQNLEAVGGSRGFSIIGGTTSFFWTYAMAALCVYVICSLVQSTYGRGFLAVRDDEIAAEAMGINTTKYKVLAFVLGAFFAGIAGGLYANFKQYIHPEGFNFLRSVDIVVMVILGGLGSTAGVVLAAVVLTILPELLRGVAGLAFLPDWLQELAKNRMILYSILLILLMLTRPQGLFGGLQRKARA